MHWSTVILISDLIKLVGLIVLLSLGSKTACSSEPLDLHPWLLVAAVLPLATEAAYALLIFLALVTCCCFKGLKDLKKQRFCFNRHGWAIATLVWDVLSTAWMCIGIAVLVALADCPELGAAVAGVIYLGLLMTRSIVLSIIWCYKSE